MGLIDLDLDYFTESGLIDHESMRELLEFVDNGVVMRNYAPVVQNDQFQVPVYGQQQNKLSQQQQVVQESQKPVSQKVKVNPNPFAGLDLSKQKQGGNKS